ncbi:MAG: magnesium transporter [Elusimicrobia bacterium]|nr:magnesium transporter [Elusimicrobiota bacterium]
MQVISLFLPEIRELLDARDFGALKRLLSQINPVDLAGGWDSFTPPEQAILFRLLPRRMATQLFEELDPRQQQALLTHVREVDIQELLSDLDPSETSQIARQLPPRLVARLFALMQKESAGQVEKMLTFPPESVGSLMKTRFVQLKPGMTARQALHHAQGSTRLSRIDQTYLDSLFVTDELGGLLGHVPLKELLVSPPDMQVADLMQGVPFRLTPEQDQEEAAGVFRKYGLGSAPVVAAQDKLVGVLVVRDVLEVIGEEDTEDIQKLGGSEALDEPYFEISFLRMVKKRAGWLCVLFLGEMLTATAMAYFEAEIARAVVLALFIPLIISSGGNSGSQAATIIVRALALGEVGLTEWWRVMRRELASGLALGALLGALGFLRISLWSQVSPLYGPHYLLVALTVGLALVLIVMWGTLSGSLLPILLRRLGLDPAVVSAPFVATLVDVTGLIIYFTVAAIILHGTLL